eukprot:256134-Rhodomonas_salina.1
MPGSGIEAAGVSQHRELPQQGAWRLPKRSWLWVLVLASLFACVCNAVWVGKYGSFSRAGNEVIDLRGQPLLHRLFIFLLYEGVLFVE